MVDNLTTLLKHPGTLHATATRTDLDKIRQDAGVDVNQKLGADGYALMNCIHTAGFPRDLWSEQELEKLKEHLQLGAQNKYDTYQPAVDKTVRSDRYCINRAKELLNRGANIECCGVNGITPLILASIRNQYAIMELLLEKGANINAQDNNNRTALHYTDDCGKCLLIHWSIKTRIILSYPLIFLVNYENEYKEGLQYQRLEAAHAALSFFPHALQLLIEGYTKSLK